MKDGVDMKYKIAICDDEEQQREYLGEIVTAWAKKNRHLVNLKIYTESSAFLFDYAEEKDFDILLLDIEMPGTNGIELAKRIRKNSTAVQIIFVTGYYDYFSDGFDVSALHYLIKPVDDNLSCRQRCVLVSTGEEDVKVPLADITYIEAENVYVVIHTVRGDYRTRISLAKFTEQLDDTFLKVHRSYVVSLKYIRKITRKEITMQGGGEIPIRRGMYDDVHDALVKYL